MQRLSALTKKNPSQRKVEYDKAIEILARLSGTAQARSCFRASKNRPMFDVPDMFRQHAGQNNSVSDNFQYNGNAIRS